MFDLQLFAERLGEIIFDNRTNAIKTANALGVPKSTIYRYLNAQHMPSVEMLSKLADFFKCSVDFLIGLDDENFATHFQKLPPFSERFRFIIKKFGVTKYRLVKDTGIHESTVYLWQNGQSKPTIESAVKLAEYFGCSVDYIIGRETERF